ncbi:MAG: TetR/AcrR family transcriptional regulator [Anaerolineales bacterium]|nr:TetR/AcrR family transcriptional regulator [Chloroflexota bacterium]MBL6983816.1 TetR/AcrR family transcriptional regulator [Anaerolineales bacterium]
MPKILKDVDIYQAVIRVVTERGYAGATTKQMAEAADVSEVTLFRKYGSKPQLVKQAIAAIVEQTSIGAAADFTGDVVADLIRIVRKYSDSAVHHGQFFMILLSEMRRYPEMTELVDAPYGVFQGFAQLLKRYQQEGILRTEHPLHALAALLGPVIYTSLIRRAFPEADVPPLDLENHVGSFLEGRRI